MERIEKLYNDPKTGLIGKAAFLKSLSKEDRELAKQFFEKSDAYQLNKPVITNFPTRQTYVAGPKIQIQADLADMSAYAKDNTNFKWLLCAIDCFSRFAWVIPLKSKEAKEVAPAIEKILKEVKFKDFQTDNGTEFYNATVKKVFKDYDVNFFSTVGSNTKAAIAERFIRTLKLIIARLWDRQGTFKYVDSLNDIVEGYNNRVHSSTGVSPKDAMEADDVKLAKIRERLYPPQVYPAKGPEFKLNDKVRVSLAQNKFAKESKNQRWSHEIFTIREVKDTIPYTYSLKDFHGEDILGPFYEPELQKTKEPETYKIEKVLKERTRKGKKEYLVRWLGYSDDFDEWITEEQMNGS